MTETAEEWRPVVGCEESYEVSDLGRVRRIRASRGTRPGRLLHPAACARGYRRVCLFLGKRHCVHRLVSTLVCEAFHGPRSPGMEVRHLDGNSSNDVAANLAWGTSAENKADMVRHGTAQSLRTHCKRGHEFTPENTIVTDLQRACRTCKKLRQRRYDAIRWGRPVPEDSL